MSLPCFPSSAEIGGTSFSVGQVRDDYAERWVVYVGKISTALVDGRAKLVKHASFLAHQRPASLVVQEARAAVDKVLAALAKRVTDFPFNRHYSRRGLAWTVLQNDFTAACSEVYHVCTVLTMAIRSLLHEETLMPPQPGKLLPYYLARDARNYLIRGQRLMVERTEGFMEQAQSFFTTGMRSPRKSLASSSQMTDSN